MAIESENQNLNKKSSNKSPHAGHRQRVIKKFMEHGLVSFAEHEVLELILFFSIPRADTNLLAHKIIDEFGSLENVLNASPEDLATVDGVGNNTAALLTMFRAVREYMNTNLYNKRIYLKDSLELGMFCLEYFSEHIDESAIMLAMNSNRQLKKVSVISTGTVSETAIYAEKIMKTALNLRAPVVVIAHNHPGGSTQPSAADKMLTKDLYELLQGVRIDLMDHIICNDKFFSSLRERGVFDEMK